LNPKLTQTDLDIENLKTEISDLKKLGGILAICVAAGMIY